MSDEYSLHNVLERMYQNQLALEAALMELTLRAEASGLEEVGENVRGALCAIGENAGFIKQGLARIRGGADLSIGSVTSLFSKHANCEISIVSSKG